MENIPRRSSLDQVGVYAGRILEGCETGRAADVQQPEQLELAINLKTAEALHLAISPTLRAPRR